MKELKLQFRAKMKDGSYFEQGTQYLTSFLRRVLILNGASHPKYLNKDLEELLEIRINEEWVKCKF